MSFSAPQAVRTDTIGLLDTTLDKSLLDQRILKGTLESQTDPIETLNGVSSDLNAKIQERLDSKLSGENLELSDTTPKTPKDLSKASNAMGIVGQVADIANSFIPEKSEYSGDKGALSQGLDTAYDSIANMAMAIPGVGTIVGGAMKLGALVGDGLNALGVGTDGMCVCAGTKVFKANGEIINIEDLKQEDGIIGWNEKTKQIVPQTIHNIIEPRQKECLEITIKSGFTLRCSMDHPVLSDNSPKARSHRINGQRIAYRDWKFRRADELKVGDFVGVANNIDYWGNITLDKAYLIGLLIGDGTYTKGNSCRLISADRSTWDYIESNGLGVINHCDDTRSDKYSTEVRTYRIIDGMDLMRQVGLVYQSGENKTLPKNIGQYTKDSICQLLAGLYDTDGSISVNEDKNNWSITLYQSNKNLLQEVKEQLHKLGIFTSISARKAAKYQLGGKIINSNQSYRLEVGDITSAIKFTQLIPLNIDYKKANLDRIYNLLKDKKAQEHPELSGAKQFKIVDIKPIGLQTVYNLQADNDHTYLANGIITHNTTTDAILGSPFLNLTPFGLINSLGASEASTITKDQEAFNTVGSSYTGTNYNVDEALTKSGKKYGLFSQKAKGQANAQIYEAQRQQDIMKDIAQDTENRLALQESMSGINSNNRKYNLQGGYNYTSARVGKNGMSIELLKRAKSITQKYQEGGNLKDPFQYYLSTLPKNQRDSAGFRVKDYWEFYGKPKDFAEAVDKGMFIYNNSDSSWHASSIALNPTTGELEYMKASTHPTRHMESDWYEQGIIYNDDGTKSVLTEGTPGYNEWKDFVKEWKLVKSEPYWKYVRRTPKSVESHKNGGPVNQVIPTNIILIDPMTIPEFQEGGQINKKSRTLQELIQYAKEVNPRFIQRMSEPLKYVEWDDSKGHHFGTHELGYTEMDGKYFVYPSIQEDKDGNLIRYTPEDWRQAVDNAYRNKNGLFFNTEEEAKIFTESQENPDGTFSGYKSGWPEFFRQRPTKYQEGGSINVIPDGALHARKHNMDMDGITQKGIPVVSETEDGKVEQQAEIEKEEIIYRKSVTQELERLCKIYYNENSTQKEKDEVAMQAGKLLVFETLYNTVDNTEKLL